MKSYSVTWWEGNEKIKSELVSATCGLDAREYFINTYKPELGIYGCIDVQEIKLEFDFLDF